MAKKKKKLSYLFILCFMGLIIGSLFWELLERFLQFLNIDLSLTLNTPLAFDFHTIAFSFRPNLGSILGLVGGIILFLLL